MQARCTNNDITTLHPNLKQFAFGQDQQGKVDLTIGKEYTVYAIRENTNGRFYLLLTDELNTELPWWMPAGFFEVTDNTKPSNWKIDTWDGYGVEKVWANPVYFDASADIEDGTPRGYKVFETMRKDSSP